MPNTGVMAYLNGLSWRDIDFIEVLTGGNAAIYGMRGGNGVVLVNTKTRYQQSLEMENGFTLINPVTYHVAPAFNMPNYADKPTKAANTPDTRNTIFWQGGIITDAYGKASVNFYTADAATRYVVTVTGLTQHGDRIYKRMVIEGK
jgi:TonB-dependent SusC/RagA subfamily outer membrane receptor